MDQDKAVRSYRKGMRIFFEGTKPLGIFSIFSGKVKVTRSLPGGRRQIVRLAGPGDLIGYRALLSDQLYKAEATAMEDCGICFIRRKTLDSLFRESTDLRQGFLKKLGQDLEEAETRLVKMAQMPVKGRIADLLCGLYRRFGSLDGRLNLGLTREEIAGLTGTTTESAIRALADFKRRGWIEGLRQDFKLLNVAALSNEANLGATSA